MIKTILALTLTIFSSNILAYDLDTNLEKIFDKKAVTLHTKSIQIGEYTSADKKPIIFDFVKVKEIGTENLAKGVMVSIHESKHSDNFSADYIDYDELTTLIKNLKVIWSYNSRLKKNEISMLSARTKSGFGIVLAEQELVNDGQKETLRFGIIATGDAYEQLDKLNDLGQLDNIDGIALVQMEGIKDIISILEKSTQASL